MDGPALSRRALIAGAAAALLPAPLAAGRAPAGLAGIIARNTRARGGAAALDRVRSCLIELDIDERGQVIHARYAADAAGLVRIDILAGGNLVYREGVDRRGGWFWDRGAAAPQPSNAQGTSALLNGAENHLFGLHRFAARGNRLRLMPSERIEGRACPVIEIRYRTGQLSYFTVDPATWLLIRRRDERAYHPDADLTRQRVETRFSDFQRVGGVVAAHRDIDVDLATGATLATHQVTRRVINPSLPDGVFDRSFGPIPG